MTREEFLNIFVRKKNTARIIIQNVIGLIVGVLFYGILVLWLYRPDRLWGLPYFIGGWFVAEAATVSYYFAFAYSKEKLKIDKKIIKDIIE